MLLSTPGSPDQIRGGLSNFSSHPASIAKGIPPIQTTKNAIHISSSVKDVVCRLGFSILYISKPPPRPQHRVEQNLCLYIPSGIPAHSPIIPKMIGKRASNDSVAIIYFLVLKLADQSKILYNNIGLNIIL